MVAFTDARIDESSGAAYSVKTPGVFWTLNDEPGIIFGVDAATGNTVMWFTIANAVPHMEDPEAISCDQQGRLWIADIGDNDADRSSVSVYVLDEPTGNGDLGDKGFARHRFVYPGGSVNAEAFLTRKTTSEVFVISKEASSKLYQFPENIPDGTTTVTDTGHTLGAYVADGSFTPDGQFLLTRRKDELTTVFVHSTADWTEQTPITVPSQTKPEGITVAADGLSFLITSEGAYSTFYSVAMPSAYQPLAAATPPDNPCGG